jgi:hypothetical protein
MAEHKISDIVRGKVVAGNWPAKQAEKFNANRVLIQQLLGYDDTGYYDYRFSVGEDFLRVRCEGLKTEFFYKLLANTDYWTWFINQWNLRDEQFINTHHVTDVLEGGNEELITALRRLYYDTHFIAVNGKVLNTGYYSMLEYIELPNGK